MSVQIWKAVLSVVIVGLLLATLGYLVHVKADSLIIGTISVALGSAIPSVIKMLSGNGNGDSKKDPPALPAVLLVAGSILAGTTDCGRPLTPEEKAFAQATCETVVAFAGTAREQALCASAPELVSLVSSIRARRADASVDQRVARLGVVSGQCQIVGTVCATDDELARAMIDVLDARGAR